jgi:hypothetical protein
MLAGGDQLQINYSHVPASDHFELYAPGTTDSSFTLAPPVALNYTGEFGGTGQLTLQAPYLDRPLTRRAPVWTGAR